MQKRTGRSRHRGRRRVGRRGGTVSKLRLCYGVPCAVILLVWCLFLLLNPTFSHRDDDHDSLGTLYIFPSSLFLVMFLMQEAASHQSPSPDGYNLLPQCKCSCVHARSYRSSSPAMIRVAPRGFQFLGGACDARCFHATEQLVFSPRSGNLGLQCSWI
jgi:hypothetical protein